MKTGEACLRAIAAAVLGVSLAACGVLGPPKAQPPLDPAAQRVAAEKLASAFASVCLTVPDPTVAKQALQAAGWPPFRTVWREPASIFYAAPPSPAGLFIIAERPWGRTAGAQQITCVGHYPAETAAPMTAAVARVWGPPRDGAGPYPGAQVWTFRVKSGALTPDPTVKGISPAETAHLAPDEAHVFVQVFHNPASGDVTSLIAVSRPSR